MAYNKRLFNGAATELGLIPYEAAVAAFLIGAFWGIKVTVQ